jgi:hypothetical protein
MERWLMEARMLVEACRVQLARRELGKRRAEIKMGII